MTKAASETPAPQKPFVFWFIKPFCITTVKTAVGTQSGRNLLEELRDEAAQSLAVAWFQVDEFHAGSRRRYVANHGGALDLAKPVPNFQLHGITDRQALIGFQKRSAECEDSNTCSPVARSRDGRMHGRLHMSAKVTSSPGVSHAGFGAGALRDSCAR